MVSYFSSCVLHLIGIRRTSVLTILVRRRHLLFCSIKLSRTLEKLVAKVGRFYLFRDRITVNINVTAKLNRKPREVRLLPDNG